MTIIHNAADALETLRAGNGKSRAHTVNTLDELAAIAARGERKLDRLLLPQHLRTGARINYVGGGPDVSAYKNSLLVSSITLRRRSDGTWALIDADRERVYSKTPERFTVTVSERQRNEGSKRVLANAFKSVDVIKAAQPGA